MNTISINQEFELIVAIITIFLLTYTAIRDYQDREVEGYIWLILIGFSLPLNIIRFFLYWNDSQWLVTFGFISIVFGISISLIFGYLGLWGGADVLGIISLSLISPLPFFVINSSFPPTSDLILFLLPLSLNIIFNAVLLQIPIPVLLAIKNIIKYKDNPTPFQYPREKSIKKIFASFLGGPESLTQLVQKKPWFYQVLESSPKSQSVPLIHTQFPTPFIRNSSEALYRWQLLRTSWWSFFMPKIKFPNIIATRKLDWKFDFKIGLSSEEEDLFRQRSTLLEAILSDNKRKYLWIQYSIPFLIPLTLGYIIAFFWGNLWVVIFTKLVGF